jgi:hypothetical protein
MFILNRLRIFLAGREIQICAAVLLVLALADWPYGYYQFLRLVVFGAAVLSAWRLWKKGNLFWASALASLALLFNPFLPVHFRRDEWAWIDTLAALAFLVSPPIKPKPLNDVDQT